MMEETRNQHENLSTESLPSSSASAPDSSRENSEALDGIKETRNPLNINNVLHTVHQDSSTSKHSYWRGSEVWDRSPESADSCSKFVDPSRTLIDTAAPFQSVKAAVNMFGGNVYWKAESAIAKEKNRNFEQKLEKAEQEGTLYVKQLQEAEDAKTRVLQELEITKKQIDELKLQLEKAQTESSQAQQDSELAHLCLEEIEQGIGYENSVAAKAQVEVARTRFMEADNELKSVEAELDALKKECDQLNRQKDIAVKKAKEAVSASNEIEKIVEKLTMELISVREEVESAQASHLQAEKRRRNATMEREQETRDWVKELKQSEEKLKSLEEKIFAVNALSLKLDTESTLLRSLKMEWAAHVETELSQEAEIVQEEKQKVAQPSTGQALAAAKKELEEVKFRIQKAKDEVNRLRIAASLLKSELEIETSNLASFKEKEKMSVMKISSLEAKSQAHSARLELTKTMEEAELAKASASTIELRLQAILKEIEAAKASEKYSLDAIKAVQESEETISKNLAGTIQDVVTISLEEYYALSKKANEAERLTNERVSAAVEELKDAKKTESINREKLEASYKEIKERKDALRDATEKAEKAEEGKLEMEQELREWRTENVQRRKANEANASSRDHSMSVRHYWQSFDGSRDMNGADPASIAIRVNSTPNPNRRYSISEVEASVSKSKERPRKKKSLFPRIAMLLVARKKAQPSN